MAGQVVQFWKSITPPAEKPPVCARLTRANLLLEDLPGGAAIGYPSYDQWMSGRLAIQLIIKLVDYP
jgi:hypothetical protein